ncbi:MAG: ROK family protein [Paludibacteraceae bacterium]|nr:ROK family protein [Paludibacteraceae bacterium]
MYSIGIDMGGTTTKIGIVDAQGKVVKRASLKTAAYPVFADYVNALYKVLLPLIEEVGGLSQIKGIGAGLPNGNYYSGCIEFAPNLPWERKVPFAKLVSEKFNLPCTVTNDANAAAIGEMTYGAAKGMKHFIMITLGTGLGSGIIIDGKLVYGSDGFAGELGHVVMVRHNGRPCGCGRTGCLEAYCSATGVARTARTMLLETNTASLLRTIDEDKITSKEVYEAAMQGDKLAIEVFNFTGKMLGEAFADFTTFSAPEAIILFGGLAKAGDLLMKPIQKSMEQSMLPLWKGKVKLLFSQLPEDDAAVLGAASLVN